MNIIILVMEQDEEIFISEQTNKDIKIKKSAATQHAVQKQLRIQFKYLRRVWQNGIFSCIRKISHLNTRNIELIS